MELRLIPVVTFAAASLLAVKVATLAHFDGHLPFETLFTKDGSIRLAAARDEDGDITGSAPAPKEAPAQPPPVSKEPASLPHPPPGVAPASVNGLSPAERSLLERLQERRQELDARGRDLEMRENLLKDAERRLETRIEELKDVEARINGKGGEQAAKFKSLVIMYEGMKPKDAARIFDKLDQAVLIDVASVMNPRKLADVIALMNAEAAQRLTVELARRNAAGERGLPATDLPKVEARPGT